MKKALLVGINYVNDANNRLAGCWNDAYNLQTYLLAKGFTTEIMTDEEKHLGGINYPNGPNIKSRLTKFISSAKSGDFLVLSYSGHGGSLRDRNADEQDGRDECIYPCDLSVIPDDELRVMLVDRLPDGVKLRVILDCCHSGSGLDLPYRYVPPTGRVVESRKTSTKDVICLSGCADPQTSADAFIAGSAQGALTATLLGIIDLPRPKGWTWKELLVILRHRLATARYDQIPQLSMCRDRAERLIVDL